MTESRIPPTGLYLDRLGAEEREAYLAATAGLNLGDEIVLARALLSLLSCDLVENRVDIVRVLGSLMALAKMQLVLTDVNPDEDLLAAAELALKGMGE